MIMTTEDVRIWERSGETGALTFALEREFNQHAAAEFAFFIRDGGIARCVASCIEETHKVPGAAEKSWRIY